MIKKKMGRVFLIVLTGVAFVASTGFMTGGHKHGAKAATSSVLINKS